MKGLRTEGDYEFLNLNWLLRAGLDEGKIEGGTVYLLVTLLTDASRGLMVESTAISAACGHDADTKAGKTTNVVALHGALWVHVREHRAVVQPHEEVEHPAVELTYPSKSDGAAVRERPIGLSACAVTHLHL
jgi:hypothetical protein